MWGGRTGCFSESKSGMLPLVHCFDPVLESWTSHECSGEPPPGIYDGACAADGDHIYVYGGTDGSSVHGSLHQLDTKSWTWEELCNDGSPTRPPMRKNGSGMVAFDSKLVLFGGCGYSAELVGAKYITEDGVSQDGKSRLTTNELHIYDLENSESGHLWTP